MPDSGSSANSTPSVPKATPLDQASKLLLAGLAAGQGDLARLLNRQSDAAESDADYNRRLRETLARQQFGGEWQPPTAPAGDSDMEIRVDSPSSVHYHQAATAERPPAAAAAASSLGKWALGLAMLLGGGGLGAAVPLAIQFLKQPPQAPAVAVPSAAAPAPASPQDWRLQIVPE